MVSTCNLLSASKEAFSLKPSNPAATRDKVTAITAKVAALSLQPQTSLSILALPTNILEYIVSFIPPTSKATTTTQVSSLQDKNALLSEALQRLLPGIPDEIKRKEFEDALANPQQFVCSKAQVSHFISNFLYYFLEQHSEMPYHSMEFANAIVMHRDSCTSPTDIFRILIQEIFSHMHFLGKDVKDHSKEVLLLAIKHIHHIADFSSSSEIKDLAFGAEAALLIDYNRLEQEEILQVISKIRCLNSQEIFRFYLNKVTAPSPEAPETLETLIKAQKMRKSIVFPYLSSKFDQWIAIQGENLLKHLFEKHSLASQQHFKEVLKQAMQKPSSEEGVFCTLLQDLFSRMHERDLTGHSLEDLRTAIETIERISRLSSSSKVKDMALEAHAALLIGYHRQENAEILQVIERISDACIKNAIRFYLNKVATPSSRVETHATLVEAMHIAADVSLNTLATQIRKWVATQSTKVIHLPVDTSPKDIFEYCIDASVNFKCVRRFEPISYDTDNLSNVALVSKTFAAVVHRQRSLALHQLLLKLSPLVKFLIEDDLKKVVQTCTANFLAFHIKYPLLTTKESFTILSREMAQINFPSLIETLEDEEQKQLYRTTLNNFNTHCLPSNGKFDEKALEASRALPTLLPLIERLLPGQSKDRFLSALTLYKEGCQEGSLATRAGIITHVAESTLNCVNPPVASYYMRSAANGSFPYPLMYWMVQKLLVENDTSGTTTRLIDEYNAYLATQEHQASTSLRIVEWYLKVGDKERALVKLNYATQELLRLDTTHDTVVFQCAGLYKASQLYEQMGDSKRALEVAQRMTDKSYLLSWGIANYNQPKTMEVYISIDSTVLKQRRIAKIQLAMSQRAS
jgi:hypothetical protein